MAPRQSKQQPTIASNVERRPRWIAPALGLALLVAAITAHFPAVHAGYTWDDDVSLFENPLIAAPDGLHRLWFTAEAADYWPLTSTMFWLEWRIWGNKPMPFHIVNILLHALAAVVLWRTLPRLNIGSLGAFLAAAIFAVHPVTVESVAWISERKNVLSMLLFLLAVLSYLRYEDFKSTRWYVAALLIGLAALLAKASVVMLPIVLLICIWWRNSRLTRQDFLKTLPFFAMSLILGLVTIWFQHNNAMAGKVVRLDGIASRVASVGWVFWFYLYKLVVPVKLAMIYPRWDIDGGNVLSYLPLGLLLACFAMLWRYRTSWRRGPLAALGTFAIVLLPVLGLLEMSYAQYSLVADHLQYPAMPAVLALVGAGLASAWSWARSGNRAAPARAIAVVIGSAVLALAVLTWRQARLYQDEVLLWSHSIACHDSGGARSNRGAAYAAIGDFDRAVHDCNKALELDQNDASTYYNRGYVHDGKGDFEQAIRDYTKSIELKPNHARAYNNRGAAYAKLGDYHQAIKDCGKAIGLESRHAFAYFNRGNAYTGLGDRRQAISDYNKAIAIKPDYAAAYINRGAAYSHLGNHKSAIQDYVKAIQLKPDYAEAYDNRGAAYTALKDFQAALADHNKAIELKPKFALAYNNRGSAFAGLGDNNRAIQDYTKAIGLDPSYIGAYYNRGVAYKQQGEYNKAIQDFTRIIELKPNWANIYNDRCVAYQEIGAIDQAIRDCSKAIELNPDLADSYYSRAVAYFVLKQYDKAWADIAKCKQLNGTINPEFVKALAQASSNPG